MIEGKIKEWLKNDVLCKLNIAKSQRNHISKSIAEICKKEFYISNKILDVWTKEVEKLQKENTILKQRKSLNENEVEKIIWKLLGEINRQDFFKNYINGDGEYVQNEYRILLNNCITAICELTYKPITREKIINALVEYEHELLSLKCDYDVIELRNKYATAILKEEK